MHGIELVTVTIKRFVSRKRLRRPVRNTISIDRVNQLRNDQALSKGSIK